MTRAPAPVSSFRPELLDLLLRAADGDTITLACPSYRIGRKLQMRLHQLRKQMQRENHARWRETYRVQTSLDYKWIRSPQHPLKDAPSTLTLRLRDTEFHTIIEGAAIAPPKLESDPLAEFVVEPENDDVLPYPGGTHE